MELLAEVTRVAWDEARPKGRKRRSGSSSKKADLKK
jgi:hypothetical protein